MTGVQSRFESWYRDRTIVVTGAYGYLGASLCQRLHKCGACLRRATRGRPGLAEDEAWIGNLLDSEFCDKLVAGADAIFHMAAQTSVRSSHENPVADLRANVETTLRLLDSARRGRSSPAFIYCGTATEVGLAASGAVG